MSVRIRDFPQLRELLKELSDAEEISDELAQAVFRDHWDDQNEVRLGPEERAPITRVASRSGERRVDPSLSPGAAVPAILEQAALVFGSHEAAEDWMTRPAIGLSSRRPIDVASAPDGENEVLDYLGRIEFGVHT